MPKNQQIPNFEVKRFLLYQLINLRLFADLKKSFLGWTWLLILPLFAILTWIFMKGAGILEPGELEIPYAAFVILSTTLWAGFFDSYKSCSQLFQNYGKILLVNKLPIEIVILSELIIGIIKFSIPFVLILLYFLIVGIQLNPLAIFFPFVYLPLLLLGTSIGLVVGLFNAVAKDFSLMADNVMKLLMLLSPVVYSPNVSQGVLAVILKYNPLTYLLSSSRTILLHGQLYQAKLSLIIMLVVVLLFILLTRFFIINTPRILERGQL